MSTKAKKPTGYVVYRGPSMLDGAPIVVLAITKKSTNSKTGDIVQTYILPDNGLSPVENAKNGLDAAVCGNCPHRRYHAGGVKGKKGACYVNLGQGPSAVTGALLRGNYPEDIAAAARACAGRMVRLGSYGDPAAVPVGVWVELLEFAAGNTGYSHQWRNPNFKDVMRYCMASADSEADRIDAKAQGFRTFRIRTDYAPLMAGEFVCPAAKESGYKKTCAECGACSGGIGTRKGDPVIIAHGSVRKYFALEVAA